MNKKIMIFLVLLSAILIGLVVFLYYRNAVFSKDVLKLEILGPSQAKAGEEITYTLTYKNNGNFVLESPKFTFHLPENSLTEDSKTRLMQSLDNIYPGQEGSLTFKTRLLGKDGDVKIATAVMSYVPHNLSARYESSTTLATRLDSVPIALTYDLPSKIEAGKDIGYSINYFSNVDYPLENISIKIDTMNGFQFISSTPTSLDPNEYKLATLQKGQGGRITIRGTLNAVTGNTVTFGAKLGMWIDGTFVIVKEVSRDAEMIPSTVSPVLTLVQTIDEPVDGVYAVHWEVKDAVNDVKNVKVKATLPILATLGDNMSPEEEAMHFSWDIISRQIVWSVGDLAVGGSLQLTFEVASTLSSSASFSNATVSGEDQFTGAPVYGSITKIFVSDIMP